MILAETPAELKASTKGRDQIGFVPTMGALHQGHQKLLETSVRENPFTVLSIFVNPLQFAPTEDLDRYPRTLESDLAMAREAGVDVVFLPTPERLTETVTTTVQVRGVTENYEGSHRPGHFDGVATIVLKLFNLVGCDNAYFGLKDLQQCALVRRMVKDLDLDINLRFVETVREPSGLALSSRNNYLTPDQRKSAAALHQTLKRIANTAVNNPEQFQTALFEGTQNLASHGFELDYLDLVDPETMQQTNPQNPNARIIVAAKFHGVRLIDNISCHP